MKHFTAEHEEAQWEERRPLFKFPRKESIQGKKKIMPPKTKSLPDYITNKLIMGKSIFNNLGKPSKSGIF